MIVVGAGGIGNWVAMDLALSGRVNNLIIIDPDIVEESNLNRTFFDYTDIGGYKVDCVAKHITVRRPQQNIQIIRDYMDEKLANLFIQKLFDGDNSYYRSDICIVDCRDDIYDDCYPLNCKLYKVGYDGMSITIDGNPRLTKVFGQRGGSYSVTPSYIGSAQLAAILVCNDILYPKSHKLYDDYRKSKGDALEVDPSFISNNSTISDCFPYVNIRAGYEHDEHGRINDTVNIECSDIIFKFVDKPTQYIIPNSDYSNLPNMPKD